LFPDVGGRCNAVNGLGEEVKVAMASMQERLSGIIEPVLSGMGYELVLLEYAPHQGSALVRLYIDAAGGITLGDCEQVSRAVEGALDVEDPIPHNYRLEVSSPGMDRPLVKREHYERFIGEQAHVQLIAPRAGGRRKFAGVLRGLTDSGVRLQTAEGEVELGFNEIERARLVPRFDEKSEGRKGS
jgi:ribosome maturation factor RimP